MAGLRLGHKSLGQKLGNQAVTELGIEIILTREAEESRI